MQIQAETN